MKFSDIPLESPSQLVVTNPEPNDHCRDGDGSSSSSRRSSTAAEDSTPSLDSKTIRRRPVSTATAIYSPANDNGEDNDPVSSTTRTQYAIAYKSDSVPTPICSISCSCRQQHSPCRSPSSLVAAVEDELRQERLARNHVELLLNSVRDVADAKQQVMEAEMQALKARLAGVVKRNFALGEILKERESKVDDLELRLADRDRDIERLHTKLDQAYDLEVRLRGKVSESEDIVRPTSKHSARSDGQEPMMQRLKGKVSMLIIRDTDFQAQRLRQLEAENAELRTEVQGLEQAVDKWFDAFETEKASYEVMKQRYLEWKSTAQEDLALLERKREAHDDLIKECEELVGILHSRDKEIAELKTDRDEMIVRVLDEKEESERYIAKKEKWKGWAWRQKRLCDQLWSMALGGCKRCGFEENKDDLLAKVRACGVTAQVNASGAINIGAREEPTAVKRQSSKAGNNDDSKASAVWDQEGSVLDSIVSIEQDHLKAITDFCKVLSKVLCDNTGLKGLQVLKQHAESN